MSATEGGNAACGHDQAQLVTSDEGTSYCPACEDEARATPKVQSGYWRPASDAANLHGSAESEIAADALSAADSSAAYLPWRVLDLFCGAGGMSKGYTLAGAEVVGVDLANQPRYPFQFIRGDVFDVLASPWFNPRSFDLIHASPPCQHYSDLARRNGNADEYPDLIGRVREILQELGVAYVIENVEGAPLINAQRICGTALGLGVNGYRLRRHRLFEATFPILKTACWCSLDPRPVIDVSGGGPTLAPRLDGGGGRTYKGTVAEKRAAMGIDWMTGSEIVEAIPPAYGDHVGLSFLAHRKDLLRVAA